MMNYDEKDDVLHEVYNGTKMHLFGWSKPVVVDLLGLRINDGQCDLLTVSEDSNQLITVCKCRAMVWKNYLLIQTNRKEASGYSIGVEVESAELVESGTRKVNGMEIDAPFYHVTSSVLKEVVEQPDDNRCEKYNASPDEMRKRIDDLEKIKNDNAAIQRDLQDQVAKLTKENESLRCDMNARDNENCALRKRLKELVEAASPFCRQHQQFVTLHDCVQYAADLIS